jgi:hypothetical protein
MNETTYTAADLDAMYDRQGRLMSDFETPGTRKADKEFFMKEILRIEAILRANNYQPK